MAGVERTLFTREHVLEYAERFRADGAIHVDEAYARPRFGGLVVPGLLVAEAMLMRAVRDDAGLLLERAFEFRFLRPLVAGRPIEFREGAGALEAWTDDHDVPVARVEMRAA